MKGLEIDMDGIKYFVKVKDSFNKTIWGTMKGVTVELFVNSFNSKRIFLQEYNGIGSNDFSKRHAKKFIKEALSL